MKYSVQILRSAEKDMDKLPAAVHTRITEKILSLENVPRPVGNKKLSGSEEYRLRAGDYRILYTVDDTGHLVTIFAVGHRKDIYR